MVERGSPPRPLDAARANVIDMLLGHVPYEGTALNDKMTAYEAALHSRGVPVDQAAREMSVLAFIAAAKAEIHDDHEVAAAFRESAQWFEERAEQLGSSE